MAAKPKRDSKYQATLMTECFGAERAWQIATREAQATSGTTSMWWYDVLRAINYTPPAREQTPAERAYDKLVAWAEQQGVEFVKNPYAQTVTVFATTFVEKV
jgi:hypothetical protein